MAALLLSACTNQPNIQPIPGQPTTIEVEQKEMQHEKESEIIKGDSQKEESADINSDNESDNNIILYFMTDTGGEYYQRFKSFSRVFESNHSTPTEILETLFLGPNETERSLGAVDNSYNLDEHFISVKVHEEIELTSAFGGNYIERNIAIVDLAKPAHDVLCGAEVGIQAAASTPISKTLMELPSIEKVIFTFEGEPMGICDV